MGGHAFGAAEILGPNQVEDAKRLIPDLMHSLGITSHKIVGSASHGGPCGDIDVIVLSRSKSLKEEKERIYLDALSLLGSSNVRKLAQTVSVLQTGFGIPHQIDIIPCSSIADADWLLKGVFRHMLFALIARDASEKMSKDGRSSKITLAIPGGLQITTNGYTTFNRSTDPTTILKHLGFPRTVRPNDVLDLRSLAFIVAEVMPQVLEQYEKYVEPLKDKRGYTDAIQIIREAQSRVHM